MMAATESADGSITHVDPRLGSAAPIDVPKARLVRETQQPALRPSELFPSELEAW